MQKRHNNHVLMFDHSEKREEYKKRSNKIIETIGLDKSEFFVQRKNNNRISISNVFHDYRKYLSIELINGAKTLYIDCKEYFLETDVDLNSLFNENNFYFKDYGEKTFKNIEIITEPEYRLHVGTNTAIRNMENRNKDNLSIKLINKLKDYNINEKEKDFMLDREKIMFNCFNNKVIYKELSIKAHSNLDIKKLFEEDFLC